MSLEGLIRIDDNGLIDTNNQEMLKNYRNNLMILTEKALREKKIDEFRIIREDNFFPYDGMWRVNSRDTYLEYARSNLAGAIREAFAYAAVETRRGFKAPFPVPPSMQEEKDAYEALDPSVGFVLEPVKFRSTKHFTVNTALEYTGSSNNVSMRRKFIIIDTLDNFCNSGYGYSINYDDAYLDITHENLPISKDAVYLINEDDYNEMMKDSEMRNQLSGKRVIRYRGDTAVAINMVLTSEGVLPLRVNGYDREYVPELEDIFRESMIKFAVDHDLEYAKGHGNIDRQGGHFSDLLDGDNEERIQYERELSEYIKEAFPELKDKHFFIYQDAKYVISIIGHERLWQAIQEFNSLQKNGYLERIRKYDMDHNVDSETHELFVETIKNIRAIYKNGYVPRSTEKLLCKFFHSRTVGEQKKAAMEINKLLMGYVNKP